jgi:hypothetical protein
LRRRELVEIVRARSGADTRDHGNQPNDCRAWSSWTGTRQVNGGQATSDDPVEDRVATHLLFRPYGNCCEAHGMYESRSTLRGHPKPRLPAYVDSSAEILKTRAGMWAAWTHVLLVVASSLVEFMLVTSPSEGMFLF